MRFVFHGVKLYVIYQETILEVSAAKIVFYLQTNYNKCCNI